MITTLVVTKGSRKDWTVDETLGFNWKTNKQTNSHDMWSLLTKGTLNQEHHTECFLCFNYANILKFEERELSIVSYILMIV